MAFGLNIAIICFLFNFAIIPSLLEIRGFQLNSSLLFFLFSISCPFFNILDWIWFDWGTRRFIEQICVYIYLLFRGSETSLVAEDFCKHLGLIFSASEQVWSSRLLRVKDGQPASQWDCPNQCEEEHKRDRLCSCRVRNRPQLSCSGITGGWGEHTSLHTQIHWYH